MRLNKGLYLIVHNANEWLLGHLDGGGRKICMSVCGGGRKKIMSACGGGRKILATSHPYMNDPPSDN